MPRLALILALSLLLPMLPSPGGWLALPAGMALADDDGDDGGDDGGDDSGDGDGDDASPSASGRDGGDRSRPGRAAPRPQRQPAAPRPGTIRAGLPDFAPDEVIALGLGPGDLGVLQALGYVVIEDRVLSSVGNLRASRLALPPGRSLDVARTELRSIAPGATADFNHFYRSEQAPPPCQGRACGPRSQINWPFPPQAPVQGCDPGGVVGMIDTGVNADHPALKGRLKVVRLAPGPHAVSDTQHGTGVAALLVGAADSQTPGLLPETRLTAVDAFHKAGSDQRTDAFRLIEGLDLLATRGVRVINLSLSGPANAVLERMVAALWQQGLLLVAAVGNDGARSGPAWPAAYPQVLAVTAVDARGHIYRRAVQGPHVELAAPGVEVWTASAGTGGRARNGTSFATPFVTAAAHVLMARGLGAAETRRALAVSATDLGATGPDPVFGYGILNADRICNGTAG